MLNIIIAGGWLMIPLILCSIIALGIIIERFINLQEKKIITEDTCDNIIENIKLDRVSNQWIKRLRDTSPLGFILATTAINSHKARAVAKEHIEESGRYIIHCLEKNLNMLGTISSIAPLLGLLGTVFGMISVFGEINKHGIGKAHTLAGGISEALITTAAGLLIAIPCVAFYRYFQRKIDGMAVTMEQKALNLLDDLNKLKQESLSNLKRPIKEKV